MNTEEKINTVLENVRPYIQMHGGDVSVEEIKGETVFIKFHGACAGCSLVGITYNKVIKPLLTEAVPEITNIVII